MHQGLACEVTVTPFYDDVNFLEHPLSRFQNHHPPPLSTSPNPFLQILGKFFFFTTFFFLRRYFGHASADIARQIRTLETDHDIFFSTFFFFLLDFREKDALRIAPTQGGDIVEIMAELQSFT